jgi:hypothetical protein
MTIHLGEPTLEILKRTPEHGRDIGRFDFLEHTPRLRYAGDDAPPFLVITSVTSDAHLAAVPLCEQLIQSTLHRLNSIVMAR